MEDFFVTGNFSYPDTILMDVVFAGFGIEDEAYSDYENVSVTNRAAVIMNGEPKRRDGRWLITKTDKPSGWANDWRRKAQAAKEAGARLALMVIHETDEEFNSYLSRYGFYMTQERMQLPKAAGDNFGIIVIKPSLAKRLLTINEDTIDQTTFPNGKPNKKKKKKVKGVAAASTEIMLFTDKEEKEVQTQNVAGLLRGDSLPDEIVVLSAHYDHLGIKDGKIYNGADDNGSGTTAILEMAEAFVLAAQNGHRPKRSLLFLSFTGEEKGLFGSEYYTTHPLFPIAKTVADLNTDMIGRVDPNHTSEEGIEDTNYVYLIGSDKLSQDLHQLSEAVNRTYTKITLDYTYNDENDPNRFYYRSDHYNFARYDVPVIFYFSGVHKDYHQPTDTPDKIMYGKAAHISKLVFYTAWQIANRPEPIRSDKPRQAIQPKKKGKRGGGF